MLASSEKASKIMRRCGVIHMRTIYLGLFIGILGVVIGASVTALAYNTSSAKRQFIFQQKQKCRQLADNWDKDHQSDTVFRVDYSVKRNSCIIATEDFVQLKDNHFSDTFHVRDFLTQEILLFKICEDNECNATVRDIEKHFNDYL